MLEHHPCTLFESWPYFLQIESFALVSVTYSFTYHFNWFARKVEISMLFIRITLKRIEHRINELYLYYLKGYCYTTLMYFPFYRFL